MAWSVDDLRQDELQLLEDGVPQAIDSFEHVAVAQGGPRSRVFVVFLDTYHTAIEDEDSSRLPLVRLLDRLLDRDDLVALTTPELAAADMTFRRKGEVLSDSDAGGLELGAPRTPPRPGLQGSAVRPVLRFHPRRRPRPGRRDEGAVAGRDHAQRARRCRRAPGHAA